MLHSYDAVNNIHDVIMTDNPHPNAVKLMFASVKSSTDQLNQMLKDKKNMYIVFSHIKNV